MKVSSRLYAWIAAFLLLFPLSVQYVFAQAAQLPPAEVCFQAQTGIAGMIATLGTITGGSGGTAGTYTNVALTGGSGSGATANITVSGGAVTTVQIFNPGTLYKVADVLSAASGNIGSTTGFSVPVASLSINSSLAGGTVGMYIPATLSTKQTWQDAAQTMLNANPIVLDANGCAIIYGTGTYRQILYDSLGNQVWDQLTSVAPVNPFWAGSATGTANAITLTDPSFPATSGRTELFMASANNTSTTTITIGVNTYSVVKDGASGLVSLSGGEIVNGNFYQVTFNAGLSQFILLNPTISNAFIPQGQAVFSAQSTTVVIVKPIGGNLITINGTNFSIPSAGVSATITSCFINGVAAQTLVANTLYYVYMFNNSGTLALDFSTTTHATDNSGGNVGVEIKSGDSTRSLVGIVFTSTGPVINATGTNLNLASWFNRTSKTCTGSFAANKTTTSTTPTEIDTSIRCNFVTWGNESITSNLFGSVSINSSTVRQMYSFLDFDGGTVSIADENISNGTVATIYPVALTFSGVLSEGNHYATLFGASPIGTVTTTWYGPNPDAINPVATMLFVGIRG